MHQSPHNALAQQRSSSGSSSKAQTSAACIHGCSASGIMPRTSTLAMLSSHLAATGKFGPSVMSVQMVTHMNGMPQSTAGHLGSGNGCPYCAGQCVCPHNSLAVNDRDVTTQWSHMNPDKPEDCTAHSNAQKVRHCHDCSKEWTATIANCTHNTLATGCPHCYKQKNKARKQRQPPVML